MLRQIHILYLLILHICKLQSQTTEDVRSQVLRLATTKYYHEAHNVVRQALNDSPSDTSVIILKARLFAWERQYDSALYLLKTVISYNPAHVEALEMITDVCLWSQHYEEAIFYCDEAIRFSPVNQALFQLKKAKALARSGHTAQSLRLLRSLPAEYSTEAELLRQEIINEHLKNKFKTGTSAIGLINGPSNLKFINLEYENRVRIPLVSKLNFCEQVNNRSLQLEVEGYPALSQKSYLYLGAGYSPLGSVFPIVNSTVELYHKLFKKAEIAGGGRFMVFDKNTRVLIVNSYIGVYIKNYWLAYRAYTTESANKWYWTHTITMRRYFKQKNFLSFFVARGSAPFFSFWYQEGFTRINSLSGGYDLHLRLKNSLYLNLRMMYELEEYQPEIYRNRYTGQMSIEKHF